MATHSDSDIEVSLRQISLFSRLLFWGEGELWEAASYWGSLRFKIALKTADVKYADLSLADRGAYALSVCMQIWNQFRPKSKTLAQYQTKKFKTKTKTKANILKSKKDASLWGRLIREMRPEEVLVTVATGIFPEVPSRVLCTTLGLTEGMRRYRLSKSLKRLGSLACENSGLAASSTTASPSASDTSASSSSTVPLRRVLSPFFCQEKLFELVQGELTESEALLVQNHLNASLQAQTDLENLKLGLNKLNEIINNESAYINSTILNRCKDAQNWRLYFEELIDWRDWKRGYQVTFAALALLILSSATMVGLSWTNVIKPWWGGYTSPVDGSNSQALVLTTVPGSSNPTSSSDADEHNGENSPLASHEEQLIEAVANSDSVKNLPSSTSVAATDHEGAGEEETEIWSGSEAASEIAEAERDQNQQKMLQQGQQIPDSVALLQQQLATGGGGVAGGAAGGGVGASFVGGQRVPSASPTSKSSLASTAVDSSSDSSSKNASVPLINNKASVGFVYRAFMDLPDLNRVTPEIVKALQDLGARKAREKPLGWRKGKSSYFHFIMPSSNEEKVRELLHKYGEVRISKDPHSWVMPEGEIRFILIIDPIDS